MKIRIHENTSLVYLKAELPEENFKLGVIRAKFQNGQTYETKELAEISVGLQELINYLARTN